MRTYVGLGSCNCCDYFFVNENKVFLIEETCLEKTIETIREKHSYLNDDDKEDFVVTSIRQENYVKVYGSLLVLCRLAAKCEDVARRMKDKKHDFWLVMGDADIKETSRVADNMSSELRAQLRGVLTKEVIDDVEIVPSEIFAEKLSKNAPAS